jgi:alpha-N-arabinofuranosidase
LDEIEYVTGDVQTKWGAQRAKDGHPAPFHLKYVEIGNEDRLSNGGPTYGDRFAQFYDAIKKNHPDLQLIATTTVTTRKADLLDDHSYAQLAPMESAATRYDAAPRDGSKVMFGEYATQSPGNQRPITPNLENALGDAAFLTGLERNSDLVLMSSYAPLFVNVNPGASQWRTDLIGYDALSSFASPSYYVQKMFNETRGDEVLVSGAENLPTVTVAGGRGGAASQVPNLFFSVTRDSAQGTIYVRIVNAGSDPQRLKIQIAGAPRVVANGHATVLTSDSATDENSIAAPLKVSPFTASVGVFAPEFTQMIHQHSVTILQIETK